MWNKNQPTSFVLSLICSLFLGCADAVTPLEYELVAIYEHDSGNFTQGLMFHEGDLYEGTGQRGDSRLIRYRDDFETPLYTRPLPNRYFGEGIAMHQGLLYQLTWQAQQGFIYQPEDLSPEGRFSYEGEGWGITSDGNKLWISNGSAYLQEISPEGETLALIEVTLEGRALNYLNELEWINGQVLANRWYDNRIYFINPDTGEVENYLDLSELASGQQTNREKVLNGIAWHPERQTLWVTGKNWEALYELRISNLE
ncbi:MAG: glutaminyl-peptide cyclotransferase [Porticoccaceae bacterium]|nr:glutaminyl-peptide cyclotransferase [Porticoccaceae bacterium]